MKTIVVDPEIELRMLTKVDSESFFDLIEKNRAYLREWIPWLDETQSLEDTQRFIEQGILQYYSNQSFQAGIWYHGELVGCIGFHPIDWRHHLSSLGYWVAEDFQGKGIVIRSVARMVQYAFEELKLNRLDLRCAPGNRKSLVIPEKLGFTREGVLREAEFLYDHFVDHAVYSLLKKEWVLTSVPK